MQHPFTALAPEYTALLARMVVTRLPEIDAVVQKRERPPALLTLIDQGRYASGCDATEVPQAVAAGSFEREGGSNFNLSPAQGDPINRKSVHVPAGRGPYPNWTAAQIDAYRIDHLDAVGRANWSWERACYEEELFNGFGYRARGVHSPYLWAGTNIYTRGKFTADHGYDPNAEDEQLGVIPMMYQIVQFRPDLALPVAFPSHTMPMQAIPAPMAPPAGVHDAADLQRALNALGADPPVAVDDSYGRETRRAVEAFQKDAGLEADGLAGPETWLAINAKLKQAAR